MHAGLDYLPMVIRQIQFEGLRTSAVRRWLVGARQELLQRQLERRASAPAGAPRTYMKSWKAMAVCAERETKSLQQALSIIEAYCRDGRRERLDRALLLHHAGSLAFQEYCRRRLELLVNPRYLAA